MDPWLPVLTFHSIDEDHSPISFPQNLFVSGLTRLKAKGYQTIDLIDAVDQLREGVPQNQSFVITFDDGYESVYRDAFPVLVSEGMSATVFLTVGVDPPASLDTRLPSLNGRSMLSWREIIEMQESGAVQFGAHTLTHPDLTRLPDHRIQAEVRESKSVIENALGSRVSAFAYPFGFYDDRCVDIVRRLFHCACSDRLGLANTNSDRFTLERVDAYYLRSEHGLERLASKRFPLYIRSRNMPRRLRRLFR